MWLPCTSKKNVTCTYRYESCLDVSIRIGPDIRSLRQDPLLGYGYFHVRIKQDTIKMRPPACQDKAR